MQDEDMHSLPGNLVMHVGGPIHWKCPKEKCTAGPTCESEIKAMSEGHKMVMGLRHLFDDLDASHVSEPTPFLHCDNQGAVTWVKLESVSCDMHQFNVFQRCIREAVKCQEVAPVHISGALNPADLFAKEMKDRGHFNWPSETE